MAKFCIYCGKPLPESGQCDCELSAAARAAAANPAPEEPAVEPAAETAAAEPAAAEPAAPAGDTGSTAAEPTEAAGGAAPQAGPAQGTPISENEYVKKTKAAVSQSVPFAKDYWKDPIGATRRVLQENNMALAIVMIVVNALMAGLLVFTCLAKLSGSMKSLVRDLGGLFGESMRVSVSAPFFPSLFYGILMSLLAMALSLLILFVLLKIFKINAKFSYLLMTVGVNSIFCTACLLLALLCALFGWVTPMLICLVLSVVVWGILGVLLLTKLFGVPLSGLMVTLAAVFFTLVIGVNLWLGSKLSMAALGQVKVEDVKISEFLDGAEDQLDDMDLEDILENAMNSMMGSYMYGF